MLVQKIKKKQKKMRAKKNPNNKGNCYNFVQAFAVGKSSCCKAAQLGQANVSGETLLLGLNTQTLRPPFGKTIHKEKKERYNEQILAAAKIRNYSTNLGMFTPNVDTMTIASENKNLLRHGNLTTNNSLKTEG